MRLVLPDISYHSVRAAAAHLSRRFFTARRAKRESWSHAQTFVLLLCSRCAGKITQQVEAKIACTNVQECLGVTPYTSLPTATFNSRTANSQWSQVRSLGEKKKKFFSATGFFRSFFNRNVLY
jgi:hypothetical protein